LFIIKSLSLGSAGVKSRLAVARLTHDVPSAEAMVNKMLTTGLPPLTLPLSPSRGEGGGEGSISKDLIHLYQMTFEERLSITRRNFTGGKNSCAVGSNDLKIIIHLL